MQSDAKTVRDYLRELPAERRIAIEAVRAVILKRLPRGYEETMQYGQAVARTPVTEFITRYERSCGK